MADATTPTPRIISIRSVVPTKVTPPGQSRRLTLSSPLPPSTLQSRLRIVMYYRRAAEEDSVRTVAAWIKESLSAALSAHPVMAGRLRRDGEEEGYWEVKLNDAGVRLVEAAVEMTVEEVLGSKEREGLEDQLCYWQDVHAESPNFSVLFYIQVTEFDGDGYSIGISCNLLLANPLFFTTFLKEWALVHKQMLVKGQLSKLHLDLGKFLKSDKPIHMKPNPSNSIMTAATATMFFKANVRDTDGYNAIITRCIYETSKRLEGRVMPEFSLLIGDQFGNLNVKSYTKDDLSKPNMVFDGTIDVCWWDEFGLEGMSLTKENKPVHVSYRIVSPKKQGLIVAMVPSFEEEGDSKLMIIITIPWKP